MLIIILLPVFLFLSADAYAAQSLILQSEGLACLGQGKSREQVETLASANALETAKQAALRHCKMQDGQSNNCLPVYDGASVKILEEMERGWAEEGAEKCCRIRLRAEVIPKITEADATQNATRGSASRGIAVVRDTDTPKPISPKAQLQIQAWTDRSGYREGERVKLFLRGNKSFYVRVIYRDAMGNIVQLLPNPYRNDTYVSGGIIHEIPSSQDKFKLEITPPFGTEEMTVYGSTSPMGEIDLEPAGAVYEVRLAKAEIGNLSRGIGGVRQGRGSQNAGSMRPMLSQANTVATRKLDLPLPSDGYKTITEFSEITIVIKTSR